MTERGGRRAGPSGSRSGVWLLGAVLATVSGALAQETPTNQAARIRIECSDFVDRFVTGDEIVHSISGNVRVQLPKLLIQAERVVLWVDRESASTLQDLSDPDTLENGLLWPPHHVASRSSDVVRRIAPGLWEIGADVFGLIHALYAEGNVILDTGSLEGLQIESESIALNFVEGSGIIRNGRISKPIPIDFEVRDTAGLRTARRYEPLLLEAKEIRLENGNLFRARDATITTCEYGQPHYRLAGEEITLEIEAPLGSSGLTAERTGRKPSVLVDIKDLTLRVGDVPLFYLPSFGFRAEKRYFPLESARAGSESKFGTFLRTRWADDLSENLEWRLNFDLFTKRGIGIGPGLGNEFSASSASGRGYLETFWIADQGSDRTATALSAEPPRQRGRIRAQELIDLPGDVSVAAEVNWRSDSTFLDEYYERENRELRPPNTSLFVKHQRDNRALFLRSDWRLNEFQTQTEYLPQLGAELVSQPILTLPDALEFLNRGRSPQAYLDLSGQVANVRTRASDELDPSLPTPEQPRTTRSDVLAQVTLPLRVGFLRFGPFTSHRFTNYDRSAPDPGRTTSGGLGRYVGTTGLRASTEFHRVFETRSKFLGIQRLRHIVTPDIRWINRYDTTQPSVEVLQFDTVDDIDEREVIRLGLRNVLQTKRQPRLLPGYFGVEGIEPRRERTVRFAEADVEIDYFPEPQRDNRGFVLGPVRLDLVANPRFFDEFDVSFLVEGAWDLQAHDLETLNLDTRFYPDEDWAIRFGYRLAKSLDESLFAASERYHLRTVGEVLRGGVELQINEKWEIAVLEQFDLQASKFLRHQVQLRRYAHRWLFEFEVSFDEGTDNLRFQIAVSPTFTLRKGRPPRFSEDVSRQTASPSGF